MNRKVLVCGGREYADTERVRAVLDDEHQRDPIGLIIEGGATGADTLARQWATDRGVEVITVPALWKVHGKAAGPIRNQRMLENYAPDLVIAFAGGKGTADMVRRAHEAACGVLVV